MSETDQQEFKLRRSIRARWRRQFGEVLEPCIINFLPLFREVQTSVHLDETARSVIDGYATPQFLQMQQLKTPGPTAGALHYFWHWYAIAKWGLNIKKARERRFKHSRTDWKGDEVN